MMPEKIAKPLKIGKKNHIQFHTMIDIYQLIHVKNIRQKNEKIKTNSKCKIG